MATYATDLAFLQDGSANDSDAESGISWTEMTSPWNVGDTPTEGEDDYFIQGLSCASTDTNNKSGLCSGCINCGSSQVASFTDDETVVLVWHVFLPGNGMDTYASGGLRGIVGSSTTVFGAWDVGGSDFGRNPYGGWHNYAIDPSKTPDYTVGSWTAGTAGSGYQYFGAATNVTALVNKGTMHGWDAIRYGRGEIYCTSTGCTFSGLAQENDYNDVSNGYNRWGLFQDQGGVYLWKGLMSLGQSGTSATFSDSNKTILIDDTPAVYAGFNKVEINHASSDITWTNITFISLGTTSPGRFEMINNATVVKSGCVFNDMDTFVYDSNATITSGTYNGCGQITHGGADFDSCAFAGYEGSVGTAYMTYAESVDPDGEMDNCSFTKGTAATHALEFDATNTPTTITLRGIAFSGYNAVNGNNDSALYFPSTTKSYTVNLVSCTGDISYRVGAGGSVDLVTDPLTVTVTVEDEDQNALEDAHVYINKPASIQAYTADTGNTAGNGALIVNEVVDTVIPQLGWCNVWVKSLNKLQQYRFESWTSKTFTFPTTVTFDCTGGGTATALQDSVNDFTALDIEVGDTVRNTTDGSWAVVDEITDASNIVTSPLSGGTLDVWTNGDTYSFHDLATTLTDNDDLVDIPLSQQKTDVSGEISQSIAGNSFSIVIRARYTEGGTKYDYAETTQALGTSDLSVTIALSEQSGIV